MPEEKKGEMTVSEAGRMGGEARKQELGHEGYKELGKQSWTANPEGAKVPELNEQDRQREQEIRAKMERNEELTTEEAGFLGGIERVRQARGE